ncbi:hydroxyacid dehydrogenase [Kineococcus rhizosphaerae]|uniref:Phosphoglycerate dehydrogenase-like enzyme n=1 Tax=Kineococcus rhizosphaerae TaxID=559628 RepID=A0A2T0R4M4_9ACTN|nr:hydroxyacid dehydrogenase [Kineococcus rhizosphaerae]PRY15311.1 phosphoglycerate dehydrogenase-like enzyme [Kineococcus rhizosphaerae]
MIRAALAMSRTSHDRVVDADFLDRLRRTVELAPGVLTEFSSPAARAVLADVEVLVTSWGCPRLDAAVLAAAPRLRAVVHAAGSVRAHVGEAAWDRGVAVSSAAAANAVPVAEYTLAVVLLAGKRVLAAADEYRRLRSRAATAVAERGGNHGATVGVLSASLVGRRVLDLLRPFDLEVLVHDPHVPDRELRALGAEPVGLLELAARSDVFSIHTPLLPETRGLVDARVLAALRDGATVVNTARGAVVDAGALTAELLSGRLSAVLDVTDPEPLPADSPLWECRNVLLTPHVAGSLGNELRRLTDCAAEEVERFAAGRPFAHPVTRTALSRTA